MPHTGFSFDDTSSSEEEPFTGTHPYASEYFPGNGGRSYGEEDECKRHNWFEAFDLDKGSLLGQMALKPRNI